MNFWGDGYQASLGCYSGANSGLWPRSLMGEVWDGSTGLVLGGGVWSEVTGCWNIRAASTCLLSFLLGRVVGITGHLSLTSMHSHDLG